MTPTRTSPARARRKEAAPPDPKALAVEFGRRLFTERDLGVIDELARPDAVFHLPGRPALSPAGFQGVVRQLWRAKPDVTAEILDVFAEGRQVAARLRFTGTHLGELFGIPPTGRRVALDELLVEQWDEQGRLVELWQEAGYLGMLTGLGLLPAPEAGPLGRLRHTLAAVPRFARLRARARSADHSRGLHAGGAQRSEDA
ncbi:ester cyclase [Streptomyces sp. NRRL WC-3742]|uniref:ester cyclase n=1 Tax=Streptomyces sp. NRRL WC-3742 TaxID=1463934 RepID=UPI00068BC6FF|nr:ester cyclase [Streptomyces sp. NRRL WC-3742]